MNKIIIFCFVCLIFPVSCSVNKEKILGRYSFQSNKLTDSLILKNDEYIHKIFNKSSLVYEESGIWNLDGDRITLLKFYNNENNPIEKPLSNKDTEKLLMHVSFPVYTQFEEISIEVNADEGIEYKKETKKK